MVERRNQHELLLQVVHLWLLQVRRVVCVCERERESE
jgi:hypothetical protein